MGRGVRVLQAGTYVGVAVGVCVVGEETLVAVGCGGEVRKR